MQGKQFVKAGDSIALNIAEGYGRYFYKENINFNYYSRRSAFEYTRCLRKASRRNLISEEKNNSLRFLFEKYFKLINAYIKSIGQINESDKVQETGLMYESKELQNLENLLTNDPMTIDQ